MNRSLVFTFLTLSVFMLASCKGPADHPVEEEPTTTESGPLKDAEGSHTYCLINDTDSVRLSITIASSQVSGTLMTRYAGKDSNTGSISGQMHGDTLFGDFTFSSEGLESVREVAFLLKENVAVEGYGPVTEQDGKFVFASRDSLSFDSSFVLSKKACH